MEINTNVKILVTVNTYGIKKEMIYIEMNNVQHTKNLLVKNKWRYKFNIALFILVLQCFETILLKCL